jgi:hypothetical protein
MFGQSDYYLYCKDQAVKDFKYWLSHSGIPSLVKLKMLRAEKIADFINSGILRLALGSCARNGTGDDQHKGVPCRLCRKS